MIFIKDSFCFSLFLIHCEKVSVEGEYTKSFAYADENPLFILGGVLLTSTNGEIT